jgi:hypothetical protein
MSSPFFSGNRNTPPVVVGRVNSTMRPFEEAIQILKPFFNQDTFVTEGDRLLELCDT